MKTRRVWKIFRWCARQLANLSFCSVWLILLAALAGQAHLLSTKRVPVPEPLRRMVERRLTEQGIQLTYGHSAMDFSGHLLLQEVRVADTDAPASPLITARLVYVQLDPWDLILGKIDIQEIRVNGLALQLPAALSVSGEDEKPISGVDFSLRPVGDQIALSYLSGYVGRVPVQATGRINRPSPRTEDARPGDAADRVVKAWIAAARQIQQAEARLAAFENPRLHLQLTPVSARVTLAAASVDLQALGVDGLSGRAHDVESRATISFNGALQKPLEINGRIGRVELPGEILADDLVFALRAGAGPVFESIALQSSALHWRKITTGPLSVTVAQPAAGLFNAEVAIGLAEGFWHLRGLAEPKQQTAQLELEGFVDDATLAFAGSLIEKDLSGLLDPAQAAPLYVRAAFLPGWKVGKVTGRLHSGSVRVGDVLLDETGTEFTYDGTHVLADNLVLRQGESLAHGSYEMDTQSNDFRFLLTGGLRPMGISGWFHDWWSNFWTMFNFDRGLPDADVDVQGRWGDRYGTRVFVEAEGAGTGIKGVAFDRVNTRLFLRPNWFDIRHFEVALGQGSAHGWLARSIDLERDTWSHMEFAVDSTLPLETISSLFKEESAELLAPYHFSTPPRLQLKGRVDSAASPVGKHESIDIDLTSTGAMTYHDFPLSDLKVVAVMRDNHIDLPSLSVMFAEGQAMGNAKLRGPENARRLAFDIKLHQANLGQVVQTVTTLQPANPKVSPQKSADLSRELMERLDRGLLNFTLAAEGDFANFHSFRGKGRAGITGAELAQLNLFGPLSEAFNGSFINFGSFSLTTVEAPFQLKADRVHFDDLRITGRSALLQAKGDYQLKDNTLDFTAKLHPFDESTSVLGSAVGFVLTPLSKVFEVKLKGTLAKPSWIFSYGPSRLFNSFGSEEKNGSVPPKPSGVLAP
ncbi:MAG: AsmA-like C-terminal region-containing protein [Rariglobus sp.]